MSHSDIELMSRPSNYDAKGQWRNDQSETTRLLKDSVRIAHETEEIGETTASKLISQREMLTKTRNYLDSIIDIGDSARESILAIRARAYRRKFNLWLTIALLAVANLYVIFIRWRNGGSLWSKKS